MMRTTYHFYIRYATVASRWKESITRHMQPLTDPEYQRIRQTMSAEFSFLRGALMVQKNAKWRKDCCQDVEAHYNLRLYRPCERIECKSEQSFPFLLVSFTNNEKKTSETKIGCFELGESVPCVHTQRVSQRVAIIK